MPNRLANETSPYLLQHKDNPVDWYAWGDEAFAEAKRLDKPVLLSVGYSACHWCHVMEHESFENEQIAALMNQTFVSIKVDREERPDVDAIYMQAVQALTGRGGWPMTVFLTPEGIPFYGGTYYPPEDRPGMPGFPRVLNAVAEAYRQKRSDIDAAGLRMLEHLSLATRLRGGDTLVTTDLLDRALATVLAGHDAERGGFGGAPKFPQAMALDFLLRSYLRSNDADALDAVERTLLAMAHGGIYDQVGGGFHRYSTDAVWLVPHFEKMLYDNALLSRLYLDAYKATGNGLYRRVVEETLDYVLREMTDAAGGFYSTQDADSEGEEGRFFLWTPAEIEAVLGPGDAKVIGGYFGVTAAGNFEGSNILSVSPQAQGVPNRGRFGGVLEVLADGTGFLRRDVDAEVASDVFVSPAQIQRFRLRAGDYVGGAVRAPQGNETSYSLVDVESVNGVDPDVAPQQPRPRPFAERLGEAKRSLYAARERRIHPARDEKVLTAWNGLMLRAFAEAALALDSQAYRDAAMRNADFLLKTMRPEGRLLRTYKPALGGVEGDGSARLLGYLEDYAMLADGLLALYHATFEARYLRAAAGLADEMIDLFWDDAVEGFFDTGRDHETLITRPRDFWDNATPSGTSVAADVLLRLAVLTDNSDYERRVLACLRALAPVIEQAPASFGRLLGALDFYLSRSQELALVWPAGAPSPVRAEPARPEPGRRVEARAMLNAVRLTYAPNLLLVGAPADDPEPPTPLLHDRPAVDGRTTAYLCERYICQAPTTDPEELRRQLEASLT